MHDIKDYINMVASGMGVELSDEKLKIVANDLLNHREYNKMLAYLEGLIRAIKDA